MACKKQIFKSKQAARRAKRAIEAERGFEFYIYRCPFCLKFHLTSFLPRWKRKAKFSKNRKQNNASG